MFFAHADDFYWQSILGERRRRVLATIFELFSSITVLRNEIFYLIGAFVLFRRKF